MAKTWASRLIRWTLLIALIGGASAYFLLTEEKIEYATEIVTEDSLKQIVSVTGSVEASTGVELRFGTSGDVSSILVQKGEQVESGQELIRLDSGRLQSNVKQALARIQIQQAELNLMLAGPSNEERALSEAKIREAEINLSNAQTEYENTLLQNAENLRQAELSVDSAEIAASQADQDYNDALESQNNTTNQINNDLEDAYEDSQPDAQTAITEIEQAMDKVDLLIEEDDDALNTEFDNEIRDAPLSLRIEVVNLYRSSKSAVAELKSRYQSLSSNWQGDDVDQFLEDLEEALEDAKQMTDGAHDILELMESDTVSVQSDIETLLGQIETRQDSLSAEIDTLQSAIQAIKSAKLSEDSSSLSASSSVKSAESALTEARNSLEIAESQLEKTTVENAIAESKAEMNIDIMQVRLEQRQAEYNDLIASPRNVDIASQEARVFEAQAAYEGNLSDLEDAILRAPSRGIVADIKVDLGESVNASDISLDFITEELQVTANISEADIAKVELGDSVSMTFDAFSINELFAGEIVSIDPAETVIQGVVYYEASILIQSEDPRIKPGMTVNIDVLADEKESVLQISPQALQYESGETFVFVLENGIAVRRDIETGLQGERKIEVLSGLEKGEEVVLYEK